MALFGGIPVWLATMLERQLEEAGFKRTGKIAHRVTNRKIDVLGVELIRKALCSKWGLPYGSFTIEPACFLPFVPSLESADFHCCRYTNTKLPSYLGCQIRFAVRTHIRQKEVSKAPNVWFVGQNSTPNEAVLRDVLEVLSEKVFPFFTHLDDLEGLLAYLQSGEDNIGKEGIWNIGKADSFRRLYLTGFTALELGEWTLAENSLDQCYETAISKSLNLRPEVLQCVKRASSLAGQHLLLPYNHNSLH